MKGMRSRKRDRKALAGGKGTAGLDDGVYHQDELSVLSEDVEADTKKSGRLKRMRTEQQIKAAREMLYVLYTFWPRCHGGKKGASQCGCNIHCKN